MILRRQSPGCRVDDPESDDMTALARRGQGLRRCGIDVARCSGRRGPGRQSRSHGASSGRLEAHCTIFKQLLELGTIAGAGLIVYHSWGQTLLHIATEGGLELGVLTPLAFGKKSDRKARQV